MKLGSLFSGSGGFELAGVLCGIEPVWASEIEPYPIRVTTARFPGMKHLGDVRGIDGSKVEPVDVITFGSPCQDLSVAGKQAGIHEGERSNLFFEAIRIIKEMRDGTAAKFPRFAVWENVPGAFSSNKGEDFRAVLEAFGSVCGGNVSIPGPPKGKWLPAGCIVGDGWSVAWRVYDAQYWGTPQRRKRIYLIADFGSERAGEILFESESSGRDSETCCKAGEGIACDAEGGIGRSYCAFNESGKGYWMSGFGCLRAEGENRQSRPGHLLCYGISRSCLKGGSGSNGGMPVEEELSPGLVAQGTGAVCFRKSAKQGHSDEKWVEDDVTNTLNGYEFHSNVRTPEVVCYDSRGNGDGKTVTCVTGDHERRVTDYSNCVVARALGMDRYTIDGTCGSLKYRDSKRGAIDVVCVGNGQTNQGFGDKAGALNCMHDQQAVVTSGAGERKYMVRRLSPLECSRLQGFPDWWCDGVEGFDTAKYRMWGNGIALPCAHDVMRRIAKALREADEDRAD